MHTDFCAAGEKLFLDFNEERLMRDFVHAQRAGDEFPAALMFAAHLQGCEECTQALIVKYATTKNLADFAVALSTT